MNDKWNPITNAKRNAEKKERRKDPNDPKYGLYGLYNTNRKMARAQKATELDRRAAALEDPDLDTSDKALIEEVLSALLAIENAADQEREFRGLGSDHPMGVNVYGASTGSPDFTIEKEGNKSSFYNNGRHPAIGRRKKGTTDLEALDSTERANIGPVGFGLYNAQKNKGQSSRLEKAIQTAVELLAESMRLQPLWRTRGAGCPQGRPDHWVCGRVFPLDADGSPLGEGVVFHENLKRTKF